MTKKTPRYLITSIGLLLLMMTLLLAACGSSTPATTATTATSQTTPSSTVSSETTQSTTVSSETTQAGPQKELNIGSLVALVTPQGIEIQKWGELFAKTINAAGGLQVGDQNYKVNWHTYDVGYQDANATQTAVQKAISQDKVTILVNDFGDATDVTANICDPAKVLQISVGFIDSVVGPNYQYYFRPNGGFLASDMPYTFAKTYKDGGAKTYIACTVDSQQGHFAAGLYGGDAKLTGLTVKDPIFFATDTVDYGPIATKIMSQNPDVVDFVMNTGEQDVNLIAALKDAGYKGKFMPGAGLDTSTLANLVTKVGAAYVEGMLMLDTDPRQIPSSINDPYLSSLVAAYTTEYGTFKTDGCFWVGGWFVLRDAINATKSVDTAVLKGYLEKSPPATKDLVGYTQLFARPDIKQDRTVDGPPGCGYGIVQGGQMVYKGQFTVQDEYIVTIKAMNLLSVYQPYWDKYGKPTFPAEEAPLSKLSWDDVTEGMTTP